MAFRMIYGLISALAEVIEAEAEPLQAPYEALYDEVFEDLGPSGIAAFQASSQLYWALSWISTILLTILGINLLIRTIVRWTEFRGLIRVAPATHSKKELTVLGRDIVMAQTFPRVLISDLIMSLQYLTMKISNWSYALFQMALLNEYRGFAKVLAHEQSPAVKHTIQSGEVVEVRTVYLIRHGESVWNLIFNQSPILVVPFRLVLSLLCELLIFCDPDSLFLDTPLSSNGIAQCDALSQWVDASGTGDHAMGTAVERKMATSLLKGEGNAIFVTSNLRRAMSTLVLGWGSNMRSGGKAALSSKPRVFVSSTLQEATRNVDAYSLAGKQGIQEVSVLERAFLKHPVSRLYRHCFDPIHNAGNKSTTSQLADRQRQALDFLFSLDAASHRELSSTSANMDDFQLRPGANVNNGCPLPLVVCGHSLYFRNLFRRYVRDDHPAREKKIQNCGVVKMEIKLVKGSDSNYYYDIDPKSILPLFKGFTT